MKQDPSCASGYALLGAQVQRLLPEARPTSSALSYWVLSRRTPGQTPLLVRRAPHGGFYGSFS